MSGYRVGAAVGPEAVIEAMEDLLSVSALRAPALRPARDELHGCATTGRFVAERVRDYQRLRDLTVAALRRISGVSVQAAGGTAYLFPRVGDGSVGDQRIAEALLNEAGVIVNPGYQFGAGRPGAFPALLRPGRDGLAARAGPYRRRPAGGPGQRGLTAGPGRSGTDRCSGEPVITSPMRHRAGRPGATRRG